MPLYEYACQKCQNQFEALVFDGEEVECPKCGEKEIERMFSVPGRPKIQDGASMPMACNSSGPPCGAPWCQKK